jgi:hypothetical protein
MPLPGKVERPQRVTRLRRIKAKSNAAGPSKQGALRCAVLKLDTEGVGAARRAEFLKLSACEEQRQFFILRKGGEATRWTTGQVILRTGGSR